MDYSKGSLTKSRAVLNDNSREALFSLCFTKKGYLLTAGSSGTVHIWVGRQIRATRKVHTGAIYSLDMIDESIISGGRDCFVRILDNKLNIIRECKLNGRVRSVDVMNNQMVVGTHEAKVYLFNDWENIQNDNPSALFNGHFDGEL